MKVAIAGAGAVGRSIARELVDNHEVMLLERNPDHIDEEAIPAATCRLGDACELSLLETVELQNFDVVIAATGDDKANVVVSLLAKTEFAVARVVARVNDPRNEWLFDESWGVDVAVSTPLAIVAAVEGAIDVGHLIRLMALGRDSRGDLGQSATNVAKVTLPDDSPLVLKRVRDLAMPEDSALVTLLRGNQLIIPKPDDVLRAGDEMLFVSASSVEEHIKAMVSGATPPRHNG